jgi:hypothetical protein
VRGGEVCEEISVEMRLAGFSVLGREKAALGRRQKAATGGENCNLQDHRINRWRLLYTQPGWESKIATAQKLALRLYWKLREAGQPGAVGSYAR